ncbi:MAG: protein kinase [Planctomycetes bacterium]|nr:protein kinase [Planctomycetota bacterium]
MDQQSTSLFGQLLDSRYRIERELGQGAIASVYLAHDELVDRRVVVKMPHLAMLSEPGFRVRFAIEAKALVGLDLPGVVTLLDTGEWQDVPYLVLVIQSGGALEDRFANGTQSPAEVAAWLPDIARARDRVHARGCLHRDVKPRKAQRFVLRFRSSSWRYRRAPPGWRRRWLAAICWVSCPACESHAVTQLEIPAWSWFERGSAELNQAGRRDVLELLRARDANNSPISVHITGRAAPFRGHRQRSRALAEARGRSIRLFLGHYGPRRLEVEVEAEVLGTPGEPVARLSW